ncbi:MAG: energy transducer TonB, partial [Myxococcota bacterium]
SGAPTLPPGVHVATAVRATRRVPPRLPPSMALPEATCRLAVDVSAGGRTRAVRVEDCPEAIAPYAERAVRRWTWDPATEDGAAVPSTTTVSFRFDP